MENETTLPLPLEATDLALLRLLYQHYAIRINQLPRFLDLLEPGVHTSSSQRKSVAHNLVERLQRFGLLHLERLQHDQHAYSWIWLTKEGAKTLGVSISGKAPSYRVLPMLSAINVVRLHLAKHEPDATWRSRVELKHDVDAVLQTDLPTAELLLPTGERIALFVMLRLQDSQERFASSMQAALERRGDDGAPYYHALWYYAAKEVAPILRSVHSRMSRFPIQERTRAIAIFSFPPAHTRLYREHQAPVAAIAWSPDGKQLATGAEQPDPESAVHLWDPLPGKETIHLSPPATPTCIAWSPEWLVVGDMQGGLSWWKPSGRHAQKASGISHHHPNMIIAIAWSPHHPDRIATCCTAGKLMLSDLRQNSTRWHVQVPHGSTALAWSPDGGHLAVGEVDGTIHFYSVQGKEEARHIKHRRASFALAWSPDGRWFASSGQDHLLDIRDSTTGQQKYVMRGRERFIRVLAWSPDSRFLASAGDGGRVQIWSTSTWTLLQTFWEHSEGITGLAWSPESAAIASASLDGSVLITPITGGKEADTKKPISVQEPLHMNAGRTER